jgi:hypothetical protein
MLSREMSIALLPSKFRKKGVIVFYFLKNFSRFRNTLWMETRLFFSEKWWSKLLFLLFITGYKIRFIWLSVTSTVPLMRPFLIKASNIP